MEAPEGVLSIPTGRSEIANFDSNNADSNLSNFHEPQNRKANGYK